MSAVPSPRAGGQPPAPAGPAPDTAMRLAQRMLAQSADGKTALAALCDFLEEAHLDEQDALALGRHLLQSTWANGKAKALGRLVTRADAEESRRLLEALAPGSGIFPLEWRLSLAWSRGGRLQEARELMATARREGRGGTAASLMEAEILQWQGALGESLGLVEAAVAQGLASALEYRRVASVLMRAGQHERAAALLEEGLRKWPGDWLLVEQLNTAQVAPQRFARQYEASIAGMEATMGTNPRLRHRLALLSLVARDFERAARVLRGAHEESVASLAVPLSKLVDSRPPDRWAALARLQDDNRCDLQVTRTPGAVATVILLCRHMFGPLPTTLVDAWLAERGCNAIFLRDFRRGIFLLGVESLGDGERETIVALRRQVAQLGAPRTVVMGASLLGFPAARYAALLGADAAVSLAGPSLVEPQQRDERALMLNRNRRLEELKGLLGPEAFDLRPVLAAAPRTQVRHFHAELHEADRLQADRLRDLPNVSVTPVPGAAEHSVAARVFAGGWLDELLPVVRAA